MPKAEREHREIPDDYTDSDKYKKEKRDGWNRQREQFMFDEFVGHIDGAMSSLLVCGAEHIEGLQQLLITAGHEVTFEDVTKADWFESPCPI